MVTSMGRRLEHSAHQSSQLCLFLGVLRCGKALRVAVVWGASELFGMASHKHARAENLDSDLAARRSTHARGDCGNCIHSCGLAATTIARHETAPERSSISAAKQCVLAMAARSASRCGARWIL